MAVTSTSIDADGNGSSLTRLLSADAVRRCCHRIGAQVETGEGRWFRFFPDRLGDAVERVVDECRHNYPDLAIPYHSRWRHFVVEGVDLWQHHVRERLGDAGPETLARTAIDLVFISVLVDAGAGPRWRYRDPVTGACLSRSEGLAAASVDLFFNHLATRDDQGGLAVDHRSLRALDAHTMASAFQHGPDNPLLGLEGRLRLLNALGERLAELAPGGLHRCGALLDRVASSRSDRRVQAGDLLAMVLGNFNVIWPSGLVVDGVALGDCGRYQALHQPGPGLVPFHKLSQWLTYSLLEPLQWAGLEVSGLDQLTGLPEYRNGGLLLDTGVLAPLDPGLLDHQLSVFHEAVVEWRASTVWLLDRIAEGVRNKLHRSAADLPLASVLQGGTWSAGRKLARELRGGEPPIRLGIDGTVF